MVLASLLLVLALPLLGLAALAIQLDAPGAPVIFRQQRVGLYGRRFTCLKLRTLAPNADFADWMALDPRYVDNWSLWLDRGDPAAHDPHGPDRVGNVNRPGGTASVERLVAIMAGGRGERLWPRSRTERPKQFLSMVEGGSLVEATYARLRLLVRPEDMVVLTARETLPLARQLLPELDAGRFLGEPVRRDTAAVAALVLAMAAALRPHPVVLALVPADHVVPDGPAFCATLEMALSAAAGNACPVLVGIPPTRAEAGYGYIHVGAPADAAGCRWVAGFVEKPASAVAERLLAGGEHLWNSGICICRSDWLRAELTRLEPALGALLTRLEGANPAEMDPDALAALLGPLPAVSLDRVLLERTPRALVIPGGFAWDDAGSWEALARLHPQDGTGNVSLGPAVLSATERSLIFAAAPHRVVVTHGVSDLVVVDTPDSLLVAGRAALDGMKQAVEAVRGAGYGQHVDHAAAVADAPPLPDVQPAERQVVVPKPWGREVWWAVTPYYAAKRLEIWAGCALSLQYHRRKHETLLVVSGRSRLRLGEDEREVGPGDVVVVPPGTIHRFEALTDTVLIEVSTPDLDDVVRLEDRYGRVPPPFPPAR